jgi:4-amino-4-deoxy-L-arabinose transferase-like glycosyltransferase
VRVFLILILIFGLATRLIALDADPPQWLSWSFGLQTDEGFYTLDARHEALFGDWAPGNFHDRLLSPLLSLLQQGVFQLMGTGSTTARLISVTFGMLTLVIFWYGLRLAYDEHVALWGILLLAISPPVVFYNRMALQETPTVFWLVLSFALWAGGRRMEKRRRFVFLLLSGVCLALAMMFKAFAIMAVPAFVAAWWKEDLRPGLLGLGLTMSLYLLFWYVPNHAELSRMGTYYRMHQFQPHSAHSVWLNIWHGFVDGERGVLPYLLRLLPIPCLLILGLVRRKRMDTDIPLALWLLCGLAFCLLSSYAPDRYYVLFYPALLGLAAIGAACLPRRLQAVCAGLFLVTSGYWYGRAWMDREYARRDASRTLTQTLPVGSILVGEMAPALCLDSRFAAAPIQAGLSNDVAPVERLHATHVLVTRGPSQQHWWQTHAPAVVQPSHWRLTLPLHDRNGDLVDVYAVGKQEH